MKFQMSFKVVAAVVVLVLVGASIAIGVGLWLGESETAAPSTAYQANLIGEPVSIDLPAQEDAVVAHKSGARIEVPEGATREQSTVSIAEVEPPASSLEVHRAFDFSVGGAELLKPVTIHIPFELGQGEDVSDIYALHWDEEVAGWKPVTGVVDESAQTIAVITSDLSVFSWAWVKVDANCDVTPSTVETGESFTVTSAGTSLTSGNIKIHMKPDIKGPVELSDQPEAKSEVAIVGKGEEFQLDVTNALEIPAEYLIRCRIFWQTIGPDVELQSQERPFTLIAVEGDAPPDLAIALPSALATARDRLVGPAVAGQDVTVRFDVGNYGRGPSGSFDIGFYLSRSEGGTDIPVGERPDLPSYEAGDVLYQREDVVQIPEDLPPGPYWLCGQIEIQGSVVDSNEDNDVSCTRTYVLPDMSGDFDETIHPVPFAEPDHWVFVPSDLASIEVAAGVTSHTDDRRELYRQLALDLMRRPEVLNRLRGDRIADLFESAGADALTGVRFNKDAIDASATINDVSELVAGAYSVEGASVSLAWLGFGIEVAEFGTLWGDIIIATGVYRHIELEAAQQTLDLLRALDLQPSAEWNAAIGDAQDELDEMTSEDEWRKFFASMREHEEELTDAYIDLAVAGGVLAGKIAAGVVLGKFAVVTAPIWIGVAVAVDTIHETDAFWDNLSIATGLAQVYERLYSLDIENQGLGIPEPDSLRLEVLAYTKFKFYHYLHEAADNRALRGRLIGNVGTNTLDQHIEHIAGERNDALEEAVDAVRLATIELGQSSISLMSGQALQLEQPVLRSGSGRILTDYDVEWLSSNPFVAKVSSSGEVTGGISGEAVISVRGHVRDEFIFDPEDFPPGARVYTSSFPVPESHQQAGTITTQSTTITFSHVVVPTYVTGEVVVTVEKSTTTDSDGQSTPSTETPTTPGAGEPFARNPAEDFNGLSAAKNNHPMGIWSDGATVWQVDHDDNKIYAYDIKTKDRVTNLDLNTLGAAGNDLATGIWSDGETMWVADWDDRRIYAYRAESKGRDPAEDFPRDNRRTTGLWSDGVTMWGVDWERGEIYAYALKTKARVADKDFDTLKAAGNDQPWGIWSDGVTMWVTDQQDHKIYAYDMITKARVPAKDFDTLMASGNHSPYGIWSDGMTMWVTDNREYKIYAYNMPPGSGATSAPTATQTTPGATTAFARKPAEDFNGLSAAKNNHPMGIWSDGATVWQVDHDDNKIYAYDIKTKDRVTNLDLNTLGAAGNDLATGIWSDGETMWVADWDDRRIYAYRAESKGRDPAEDFPRDNRRTTGLWSDGVTMWGVDWERGEIYAYALKTKARVADKDFDTLKAAGNDQPWGIWSDGVTMWVTDQQDHKIYAYDMITKARVPAKDFDTLMASGNHSPYGIWSDGMTMWVTDNREYKIYAYNMPPGSGATSAPTATQTTPGATTAFARKPAEDFNGLSAAKNNHPMGIWSDGATVWQVDHDDNKIYAYDIKTKDRVTNLDLNTLGAAGNDLATGIWSDGETMWVADWDDRRIYAYRAESKGRDPAEDFPRDNRRTTGLWSDGVTMWGVDWERGEIYAYALKTKARVADKDFDTLKAAGNDQPWGIWSDGVTMWVTDQQDHKIYAYDMITKARVPAKDFDTLMASGNHSPYGIWSDGMTMWVTDNREYKIYAYNMPPGSGGALGDSTHAP